MERPLSRHQKFRLRKKEEEQAKDRDIEMLNQQILIKDGEIALLRSEIEMQRSGKDEQLAHLRSENDMLRNNKDEQLARLRSEIEMLRKEIISFKHTNTLKHRRNAPISI
ncbi:hypothetical protein V6N13_132869 [Hibiscus sabdariffa]